MKFKNKKTWFISDLHFGDDRFDILQRPFKSLDEMHETLISNWNSRVSDNDLVFLLGDAVYVDDDKYFNLLGELKGDKLLIIGNHDEEKLDKLNDHFINMVDEAFITIGGDGYYLNHYPVNCKKEHFNICGHIHSSWKVQRNAINVGVDVNHFRPYSLNDIKFLQNAISDFYDENVFAGELDCNLSNK